MRESDFGSDIPNIGTREIRLGECFRKAKITEFNRVILVEE